MPAPYARRYAGSSCLPTILGSLALLTLIPSLASAQTYNITSRTDLAMGTGLEWVTVVDVNQDTRPDLISANWTSNDITVRLATGLPGNFGPVASYPAGINPYGLAALDVNGDLFIDMAVANFNGGTVSILLGDGTGSFGSPVDYTAGAGTACAVLADFNTDYIPDLATVNWNDNSASLLLGNGSGGFLPKVDFPTGGGPNWVVTCDLNEDGNADLVSANAGANSVSVLL